MPESRPPDQTRASASTRFLRSVGLLTCLLVAVVVMLELLGLVLPVLSKEALDPEALQMSNARVQPHPYLAYVNKPGFSQQNDVEQVSHNSMGFRGPEITWEKPPGTVRIVCLGGSSTYGFGPSSDAMTWPALLETYLNEAAAPGESRYQVINGGSQGYSTFESLINLELRMVDLQPDVVLVYHGINDMRCAIYRTPTHDNTHWRAIWPVERPSGFEKLVQRTTTFRLLRSLDPGWKASRSQLTSYVVADFDAVADQYAKSDPPQLGFENFRRNLRSIAAVSRIHGARPVFVTQGARASDILESKTPSAQIQVASLERMREILREVARERDVPVIEAAAVLDGESARQRAELDASGKRDVKDGIFTKDVHLTDEGNRLLARTLAENLRSMKLVP